MAKPPPEPVDTLVELERLLGIAKYIDRKLRKLYAKDPMNEVHVEEELCAEIILKFGRRLELEVAHDWVTKIAYEKALEDEWKEAHPSTPPLVKKPGTNIWD